MDARGTTAHGGCRRTAPAPRAPAPGGVPRGEGAGLPPRAGREAGRSAAAGRHPRLVTPVR
ncbi:hypothetical protein SUDANB140_06539 [Streptomyces sp. enrichment culture]